MDKEREATPAQIARHEERIARAEARKPRKHNPYKYPPHPFAFETADDDPRND